MRVCAQHLTEVTDPRGNGWDGPETKLFLVFGDLGV